MKNLTSYSNEIANDTQLAASMPKWYARTTVVDFAKAKTEDGYLDLSRGTTYQVGDRLMFIQCNDFENATKNNLGQIYTVTEATIDGKYKFEQGIPAFDSGLYFVILFAENNDHDVDVAAAVVPVTIEMILEDQKSEDHPLRKLGLQSPGWYRWQAVTRHDGELIIRARMIVSMHGFHSPEGTSGDSGETFQPGTGEDVGDGELMFDENGEITLG